MTKDDAASDAARRYLRRLRRAFIVPAPMQARGAGSHVVLAARRADRLEEAAARARAQGGSAQAQVLDVTDVAAVAAFARSLDRCDVLVNNAGGAFGMEEVSDADPADWRLMYEV